MVPEPPGGQEGPPRTLQQPQWRLASPRGDVLPLPPEGGRVPSACMESASGRLLCSEAICPEQAPQDGVC